MATTQPEERSDLSSLAALLRRRLWIVAVGVLVGLGVALAIAESQPTRYQSTATLLFRPVLIDVAVTGTTLELPSTDPTRDAATDVSLVSQQDVMAAAARRLGPPYTATSLAKDVTIASQGQTDLVGVQASAPTAAQAALVANTVADEYISVSSQTLSSQVNQAEAGIRAQMGKRGVSRTERQAMSAALTKLAVLESLGPQSVHLSQAAVQPTAPSSPKPTLDGLIGALGGLVIGLAVAFALEQADPRLRRAVDVERETGLALLGVI
ncbi:MAG: YveK family protein, partial [Solirubrobacteraceae bacterium]